MFRDDLNAEALVMVLLFLILGVTATGWLVWDVVAADEHLSREAYQESLELCEQFDENRSMEMVNFTREGVRVENTSPPSCNYNYSSYQRMQSETILTGPPSPWWYRLVLAGLSVASFVLVALAVFEDAPQLVEKAIGTVEDE